MCKNYVIAIDGEAGTGKSTLAKSIAKKYNLYIWILVQCIDVLLLIC